MIIVMFEVELFDGCKEEYHALGRNLQASLQKQKGFLGGKTYICEDNPNREVSINYWDNEDAVMEWRNFLGHRMSQKKGRESLFKSYKIIVSNEIRTYTKEVRSSAPLDSTAFWEEN